MDGCIQHTDEEKSSFPHEMRRSRKIKTAKCSSEFLISLPRRSRRRVESLSSHSSTAMWCRRRFHLNPPLIPSYKRWQAIKLNRFEMLCVYLNPFRGESLLFCIFIRLSLFELFVPCHSSILEHLTMKMYLKWWKTTRRESTSSSHYHNEESAQC